MFHWYDLYCCYITIAGLPAHYYSAHISVERLRRSDLQGVKADNLWLNLQMSLPHNYEPNKLYSRMLPSSVVVNSTRSHCNNTQRKLNHGSTHILWNIYTCNTYMHIYIPRYMHTFTTYPHIIAVVKWRGCVSGAFTVTRGTRQGSVLSPYLFNI